MKPEKTVRRAEASGPPESKPKTKKEIPMGRTVSFQPAADVRDLLIEARSAGLELSDILNQSLRAHGKTVARQMAEDMRRKIDEFSRRVQ